MAEQTDNGWRTTFESILFQHSHKILQKYSLIFAIVFHFGVFNLFLIFFHHNIIDAKNSNLCAMTLETLRTFSTTELKAEYFASFCLLLHGGMHSHIVKKGTTDGGFITTGQEHNLVENKLITNVSIVFIDHNLIISHHLDLLILDIHNSKYIATRLCL